MDFIVADIKEIFEDILKNKLIAKNEKYGNSVYDEEGGLFNDLDIEQRIGTRLDDKLRRLKTLDKNSRKYDSELEEIVAYLLLLINYRNKNTKEKANLSKKLGVPSQLLTDKSSHKKIVEMKKANFYDTCIESLPRHDNCGTLQDPYLNWSPINFVCQCNDKGLCTMCGTCMKLGNKREMLGVRK